MKIYKNLFLLLILCIMSNACEDNSAVNPYVDMSEFEIACKVTGGIYENGKCKCNNAFCDEGDVCNMATAKCPEKQIPEVCAKDSVTCTNSMMYRCNNNHNFVEDKIC